MGGASYPKPDGERRNRAERQLDWTVLPFEGRDGDPPALPSWRDWTAQTLAWWAELWSTPQATAWDQTGRSMHTLALLHHEMIDGGNAAKIAAEMRQHEDRHGLTPKAMFQMRWRVAGEPSQPATSAPVLELVPTPPRPDPQSVPSKRAKKAEWVEWAVAWGADRSAAEKLSKAHLIREFSSVATTAPSPVMAGARPRSKAAQRLKERTTR